MAIFGNNQRNWVFFVTALLVAGGIKYWKGSGNQNQVQQNQNQNQNQNWSPGKPCSGTGSGTVVPPPLVPSTSMSTSKSLSERWREWRAPSPSSSSLSSVSPSVQIGSNIPRPIDNWDNQNFLIFGPTSPYTIYNRGHNSSRRRPLYPGNNIEVVPKQSHFNPSLGYKNSLPSMPQPAQPAQSGPSGSQHHRQRNTKLKKQANIALANAKWNRWVQSHSSSTTKNNVPKDDSTYGLTYYYALNPCWRDNVRQGGTASYQNGALTIYNQNVNNQTFVISSVTFTTNSADVVFVEASNTTNAAAGSATFPIGTVQQTDVNQGIWTWTWKSSSGDNIGYTLNAQSSSMTISLGMKDCDPLKSTPLCVIPFADPPYDVMVTFSTTSESNLVAEATVYGMCAMFAPKSPDFSACMDGTYRATGSSKMIGTYFPEWGFWNNYFPVKVTSTECINNFMPLPYSYGEPTLYLPAVDIVYYAFIVPGKFVLGTIPDTIDATTSCPQGGCYVAIQDGTQFDVYDTVASPYNLATWIMIKRQYPYLTFSLSFGGYSVSYPFTQFDYLPKDATGTTTSTFDYSKFSSLAASAISQLNSGDNFAQNSPNINKYGIDIDWEYPGEATKICYTIPPPTSTSGGIYYCYNVTDKKDPVTEVSIFSSLLTKLKSGTIVPPPFVSAALPAGKTEIKLLATAFPAIATAIDAANVMFYDYHGQWDIGETSNFMAPYNVAPQDPDPQSSSSIVGTITTYSLLGNNNDWKTFLAKVSIGLPNYGRLEQVQSKGSCDSNTSDSTLYVPLVNFTQSTGMGEQNDLSSVWSYKCLYGLFTKLSSKYCVKQKLSTEDYPETNALLASILVGNIKSTPYDSSAGNNLNANSFEAFATGTEIYQDGGTNFVFLSWDDIDSVFQKISSFQFAYGQFQGVYFWSSDEDLQTGDEDFQDASLLLAAQKTLISLQNPALSPETDSSNEDTNRQKAPYYTIPYIYSSPRPTWGNALFPNLNPSPSFFESPYYYYYPPNYAPGYFYPPHYHYHQRDVNDSSSGIPSTLDNQPISSSPSNNQPIPTTTDNSGSTNKDNYLPYCSSQNEQGGTQDENVYSANGNTGDFGDYLLFYVGVVFAFSLFFGISFWVVCARTSNFEVGSSNTRRRHRR